MSSRDELIYGECFCGEIRYSLEGPLQPAKSCHCSRCRKAFSGSGSVMTAVKGNHFNWISGKDGLAEYINKQGWGLGFCSKCGSTLVGIYNGEVFGITLGTLNDDPEVHIKEHIFVGSKACWDEIGGEALQLDET